MMVHCAGFQWSSCTQLPLTYSPHHPWSCASLSTLVVELPAASFASALYAAESVLGPSHPPSAGPAREFC